MPELELKFQVPSDQRPALLNDVLAHHPVPQRLRARYFDTVDRRLARHAIALRLRQEGDDWVQTLKAEGDSPVSREEHEVPVRAHKGRTPALDVGRHAGSPAHDRLMRLLGPDGAEALVESHATDVLRRRVQMAVDGGEVELALDIGYLEAGDRRREVHEIEFEWKGGTPAALFSLAGAWAERHGLWLDTVSKGERGHLLATGMKHAPAAHASPMRRVPGEPEAFVREAVRACLDQVLRNASDVAAGQASTEHVHQLRVGVRRLRTVLRELGPLDAALDPAWEAPLAEVFRELGRHRDEELRVSAIGEALSAAGAPEPRPAAPAEPALTPAALVQAAPFQRALLALLAFASESPAGDAPQAAAGNAVAAVGARLDRLHRQVAKAAKRFVELDGEAQHGVRKRLKRLRYLAEFVAPAFRKRRVADYFRDLKPAQDALGEHNDGVTALAHYREAGGDDPHAWFAIGWLSARQQTSTRAAAKTLRRAARAKPFWHGRPAHRLR